MTEQATERSVVGKGTTFAGTLRSQAPVTVSGTFEGEVDAPEVDVTESGVLAGRMKVTSLRSHGEVSGQIEAEHLELAGRVRDATSIRAKRIEVKLTTGDEDHLAVSFGNCTLEVGDVPVPASAAAARPGQKP